MNKLLIMLAAVAFSIGIVFAQVAPGTTVVGVCPAVPVASGSTTTICPSTLASFPAPCSAKESTSITGSPVTLILGAEEHYALSNLNVRHLNWREVGLNASSIFSPVNPLFNQQINLSVIRHGNPYYPYYAISSDAHVAGAEETFVQLPNTLSATDRDTLTAVKERYRGTTPQQAMALGYQPMGVCLQNVGQVYLNQSQIDNRFDPMMPEALSFDNRGRLVAVHYILLSDVPFAAFGQQLQPSPLVQGALQLPVWLYSNNQNGMFTLQNTKNVCSQ